MFARGPAVAVLILLESEGKTYAVLTEQVLVIFLPFVDLELEEEMTSWNSNTILLFKRSGFLLES